MALNPGSYARAAGLQSEINKVTVTRVAGSEVQFQRTIDTYQKDLRYNVNQIGREQKQLKKSMRRYYKKLRQGKRERRQRETKEKEDSARLRLNARQFKEAEQAVRRRNVLLVNHPDHHPSEATPMIQGEDAEAAAAAAVAADGRSLDSAVAAEHHPSRVSSVSTTLPESPDSGIGTDPDERSSAASTAGSVTEGAHPAAEESGGGGGGSGVRRKVFLTSNKTKLPYLKASRGGGANKDRTQGGERPQHHGDESSPDEDGSASAQTNAEDIFLPVINEEEAEDKERECGDRSKVCPSDASHTQTPREGKTKENVALTSSVTERLPRTSSVAHLNTKTVSASMDSHATSNVTENDDANASSSQSADFSGSVPTPRRRRQRKTPGVSFGDLMKLQHTHTSGTKRLFSLVDRMASKHGIVDNPPPSLNSASIDPRSNVKIKQRGEKLLASQMSGGMVKHASDVLYSMKYGYRDSDGAFSDDVTSPVFVLSDVAASAANNREGAEASSWNYSDNAKKSQVAATVPDLTDVTDVIKTDVVDAASRKLSLTTGRRESVDVTSAHYPDAVPHKLSVTSSGRRESIDVTSPYYSFGDVASPLFEGIASDGGVTTQHLLDVASERRGSRVRHQPLSMTQLSEHVTKARDRNYLRASSPGSQLPLQSSNSDHREESPSRSQLVAPVSGTSRPSQRLSPLPRGGGRPSVRPRRDSVSNQLQMRLSVPKDEGKMAWQSAFGRLKVLHTLFDLSPHFDKDG